MDEWKAFTCAPEGTHHVLHGRPVYLKRFDEVLKFHSPGLAAVRDRSGAYHIDPGGQAVYAQRHLRTFGFYQERAAVRTSSGWMHIVPDGTRSIQSATPGAGIFRKGVARFVCSTSAIATSLSMARPSTRNAIATWGTIAMAWRSSSGRWTS